MVDESSNHLDDWIPSEVVQDLGHIWHIHGPPWHSSKYDPVSDSSVMQPGEKASATEKYRCQHRCRHYTKASGLHLS